MLCVVCTMHVVMRRAGFLVEPQNQGQRFVCQWFGLKSTRMVCLWFGFKTTRTVFSGLASKPAATVFSSLASNPVATVFSGLASKPVATVSLGLASKLVVMVFWFGPQIWQLRFGDLTLKITMAVSWFGPQNQVGDGLSVVPQNRWEDGVGVGHASRSSSSLHLEASLARVSEFASKLVEARWRVVHVAPSWRLSRDQLEYGLVDVTGSLDPATLTLPFSLYKVLGAF
jgi:hypothetical protein